MKAVALGGGHGTAASLRSLCALDAEVTGVVSVADDGGSTGRLRSLLNVAAVGDLRLCLGATSQAPPELAHALEHRFKDGELTGHPVGNLLLAGLLEATGDLEASVAMVASMIASRATILPATSEGVVLVAQTSHGMVRGQSAIKGASGISAIGIDPERPRVPASAITCIENADTILIGPGSLFTSVLATCVIPEINQALASSRARKIYVANLRCEANETLGFTLQDHINALLAHGVVPTDVLVDATSPFAGHSSSLPTTTLLLTGSNSLVHDVSKLAAAVSVVCTDAVPLHEGDAHGDTSSN